MQPWPIFPEPVHPESWNTLDHDIEQGNWNQQYHPHPSFSTVHTDLQRIDSIAGSLCENIPMRNGGMGGPDQTQGQWGDLDSQPHTQVNVFDTLLQSMKSKGSWNARSASSEQAHKKRKSLKQSWSQGKKLRIHIDRWPSMVLILLPGHRYCGLDRIVKPYRVHYCRTCGTVHFEWCFQMSLCSAYL